MTLSELHQKVRGAVGAKAHSSITASVIQSATYGPEASISLYAYGEGWESPIDIDAESFEDAWEQFQRATSEPAPAEQRLAEMDCDLENVNR